MSGRAVNLAKMEQFFLICIADIGSEQYTIQAFFSESFFRFWQREADELDMWIFPVFVKHGFGNVSEYSNSGLIKIFLRV